ncbi:MAG: adenylate/guanylate cyclase domain-containing protein [Rhodospirillales bacterium]|nr:adenylate/guanylate cyclase domain-containing protein [Rhodospirillales bacterium]
MLKKMSDFVFGERPQAHLPERVRRAIVDLQVNSEILIGWAQLCLVLFFLLLYSVAPKTSEGTDFMPVPWVLSAYLVFTLGRLYAAYRCTLPRWFLMTSVVIDMALLMGLIWSFHLQYEQPASFYLKAPTLLYVFIFISLRALRFDPKYVAAAGLAAACGWLFLLWYALFGENRIQDLTTRDYILYMTSNRVLIGAEIDKILSILVVTAILAIALVRAQRMLTREVADAAAAQELSRFVAPEIADRITTADKVMQPGDGETKEASVLFSDIEGFSTVSEKLSPDALVRMLNEYFAAVSEVIERHGGAINQFQGDAMLVTFNTVTTDADHAASAVKTALGIQRITEERLFCGDIRLPTRCGVNTGDIVSGAIGTPERLLYTVHGDEVNIAARLEQLNKQYGTYVLVTEQTARAAGSGFAFDVVGEVTVRGRAAPTCVMTVKAK